ncbi:MAG: tRNA1(Val) (adenine(37)-N6)-methyltransferase [Desulfobacterales bacterium]|nr:tRNA1(Val) (adenine(37)-N6)-methyltransferase [Desulfobacterales bacterium]
MPPISRDAFFNGRLRVKQLRDGYRFSIDAILLADAVRPGPGETVVDLGTGCGIIALILARRHPDIRVHAVEIQESLVRIAESNVRENGMAGRIAVLRQDMRSLNPSLIPQPVHWVVSNPPYGRIDAGRINPDASRALARHEIAVTLTDVVAAARRLLPLSGRLAMVYPAERLAELIDCMGAAGIAPKVLRMVHATPGSDARRVLVTGVRGGRSGIQVAPALYVHGPDGAYSAEVTAMFDA